MQIRIIEPVHKQINQARLDGGTYYQLKTARQQPTEAKSPLIKSVSPLYPLLVSPIKTIASFIASISGGDDVIGSLNRSLGALIKPWSAFNKPWGEFNKPLCATNKMWNEPNESWSVPNESWSVPNKSWNAPNKSWSVPNKSWNAPNEIWSAPNESWSSLNEMWSTPNSLKDTFSIKIIKQNKQFDAVLLLPCATVVQAVVHYSSNGGGFKVYPAQVALKAPYGALCFLHPALAGKHSSPDCRNANFGFPLFFSNKVFCV
jgi:hypothetical protein